MTKSKPAAKVGKKRQQSDGDSSSDSDVQLLQRHAKEPREATPKVRTRKPPAVKLDAQGLAAHAKSVGEYMVEQQKSESAKEEESLSKKRDGLKSILPKDYVILDKNEYHEHSLLTPKMLQYDHLIVCLKCKKAYEDGDRNLRVSSIYHSTDHIRSIENHHQAFHSAVATSEKKLGGAVDVFRFVLSCLKHGLRASQAAGICRDNPAIIGSVSEFFHRMFARRRWPQSSWRRSIPGGC